MPGHASVKLDRSELAAWRGFLGVHAAVVRRLDEDLRAAHGVSLSEYEVLLLLSEAPGGRRRLGELAAAGLITQSGGSRMVDRLAKGGLVERERCDDDRRGSFATLTDGGRAALARARETHLAGVRRLFLEPTADMHAALAGAWRAVLGPLDG